MFICEIQKKKKKTTKRENKVIIAGRYNIEKKKATFCFANTQSDKIINANEIIKNMQFKVE